MRGYSNLDKRVERMAEQGDYKDIPELITTCRGGYGVLGLERVGKALTKESKFDRTIFYLLAGVDTIFETRISLNYVFWAHKRTHKRRKNRPLEEIPEN